jgi:predicted glycosyltransferase
LQDDDVTAVPESALLHYFTRHILTQAYSDMGKNAHKKIPMYSFKELGYLYPSRFKPDYSVVERFNPTKEDYFILRLVSLKSTHDTGKSGLNDDDVKRLIEMLKKHGKVFITSERELPADFEKYRISLPVHEISHALNYAKLLIADSQTMSAEAGVLGTPYIRFNDFVGKISYLEDLEQNYELGFGIRTENKEKLFEKVEELLNLKDIDTIWQQKRVRMLADKVDLTEYMIWLFENYPKSAEIINDNPDYQLKFN